MDYYELTLFFYGILGIFWHSECAIELRISPSPATTDDPVTFIMDTKMNAGGSKFGPEAARFFHIHLNDKSKCRILMEVTDNKCTKSVSFDDKPKYGDCWKLSEADFKHPENCSFLKMTVKAASRIYQGKYMYDLEIFESLTQKNRLASSDVELKVGDKSPPISTFVVKDALDTTEQVNGSTLQVNLNLSIACETSNSDPKPAFTVTITGKSDRKVEAGKQTSISFYEVVPRNPVTTVTCTAYNGFGTEMKRVLTYYSQYKPKTSAELKKFSVLPSVVTIDYDTDIVLCEVFNNPPTDRLSVSAFEPDISEWFESGYPKTVVDSTGGISRVIVRVKSDAKADEDINTLKYNCKFPDIDPLPVEVRLQEDAILKLTTTTSLPLSTTTESEESAKQGTVILGVAIAAVVVVVIIIIAIIVFVKRKQGPSSKSTADEKGQYGQLAQKDGKDGSRVEDLPSTTV